MPGTIKILCIRMKILSHRNNIVLFLACNMAAVQNLYMRVFTVFLRCEKFMRAVLSFQRLFF